MNVHQGLFFCIISALYHGNTRLVGAHLYTGPEGGTASINCYLSLTGVTKFLCRNECDGEGVLIKTDGDSAQSGKYSIEYRNDSSGGQMSVTLKRLTRSDSGRYICGLGEASVPVSKSFIDIRVLDASLLDRNSRFVRTNTEGENVVMGCFNTVYGRQKFFCRGECDDEGDVLIETERNTSQNGRYIIEYNKAWSHRLYVTIKQVTKSDTGRYKCGYGRASFPDSFSSFTIRVVDANPSWILQPTATPSLTPTWFPDHFWIPVACVSIAFVLFAVFLLLLYKWKIRRSVRGNADAVVMEASTIYENMASSSTCGDHIYHGLQPASKDPDQTYCNLRQKC